MNIEEFIQEKIKRWVEAGIWKANQRRQLQELETALREAVEKVDKEWEHDVELIKSDTFASGVRAVVLEKKDSTFEEPYWPYCKACRKSTDFCKCEGFNSAVDELEAVKAKLLGGTDEPCEHDYDGGHTCLKCKNEDYSFICKHPRYCRCTN